MGISPGKLSLNRGEQLPTTATEQVQQVKLVAPTGTVNVAISPINNGGSNVSLRRALVGTGHFRNLQAFFNQSGDEAMKASVTMTPRISRASDPSIFMNTTRSDISPG